MNFVARTLSFLFLVLSCNVFLTAQKQAPPAPPQSPRQALIEVINGGNKGVIKHLTTEVQQMLTQSSSHGFYGLSILDAFKNQPGMQIQAFETGPVLFSVSQPREHEKFEVNVNNDDMSGDQDTLELSFHVFRDGLEQQGEWQPFLSHISVTMVRQEEIWRLSKIGVGAEFPIGDPEFLKKTFLKSADKVTPGGGFVGARIGVPEVRTELRAGDSAHSVEWEPGQLVATLGLAEQTFARQHADVGFTCSITELVDVGKHFGLNPEMRGGLYNGYKFNLTGCQGTPAESFHITAEPIGKGGKAYCTDATQNLRVSDDGRAPTCLSAGRVEQTFPGQDEVVGWDPVSAAPPTKPREPQ